MHKLLGVGLLGIVEDLVCQSLLDDLPVQHHDGPVRQHPDHGKVMGDQHDGDIKLLADLPDQLQDPCLDGEVEPCRHLVQEEDRRIVGERLGYLHPLRR